MSGDDLSAGLSSLFVVVVVAALAPIVVGLLARFRVPQVVVLIVGGIIIGPHVLDWADPARIGLLANVGLGFLFLLAGYELELHLFRQRPGRLALIGWFVTVALACAVVGLLAAAGLVRAFVPVALALTTTALGTLLPILRDNNMLGGTFGSFVLATGAVGEFLPIVAIAIFLVESERAVDPMRALEHAERALGIGRRMRNVDLEIAALGRAGLAEVGLGRLEEGMTRFDEGLAASAAGESTDLRTVGDLYCAANLAGEITLDVTRFGQWTKTIMEFMQRTGHRDLLTFCGTCCAEVCRAAGRWEDGEGWLTRTLSQLQQSGQRARCVHPATRLAAYRVSQGRFEDAEHLLRGYEDLPEAVPAVVALHLARGQTAPAAARLHRRLNEIGRDNLVAVPLLAQLVEVQLTQPDLGGAADTAQSLAAIAAQSGHLRAEAEAELALGSVKAAANDTSGARVHLDRSLALFVRLRMPHAAGRVHLALARTLAESEPDTAVGEARQALYTFDDLGATHDADRAAALLRSLGVSGRTGPKLVGELSKREVEVLRLLGEGLTNAEIAARLYISTKTVATHVGNLFAKLQLRNRAEAAAFANQHRNQ